MNREEAIKQIERLYPPDSEIPDIAAIGRNLLNRTKKQLNWKKESTDVLLLFAELCKLEAEHQIKLCEVTNEKLVK